MGVPTMYVRLLAQADFTAKLQTLALVLFAVGTAAGLRLSTRSVERTAPPSVALRQYRAPA